MSSRPFSTSLRLSLLASLGLLPVACGGAFRGGEDEGGSGSGGSQSSAGVGGTKALAGASAGGTKATAGSHTGGSGSVAGSSVGGTTGTGGTTPTLPTCTSPEKDPETGIVRCAEGYTYRTKPSRCVTLDAAGAPAPDVKPPLTEHVDCTDDPTVCDQYLYGYCAADGVPSPNSSCRTGCVTDSGCAPGGMCRCEGNRAFGVCTADTCDSDADCKPGYHCASYPGACGAGPYACQQPGDDCDSCAPNEICVFQEDGRRGCSPSPVCGRPFLVEAEARVAPTAPRADWADGRLAWPRVDHLTRAERAALAAHWTKLGQMEHASIAAFARFQLQLLALGAPAELVQACNQALVDETNHTQLCFGLASAYAGHPVGPGPLDVEHSLSVTDLADIVDLVIHEGCFGETSAALDALESADTASDPLVASTYRTIAADEQRHAELAFRFVRWALERDRGVVAERVIASLAHAPASARNVAVPCLRALLEQQLAA